MRPWHLGNTTVRSPFRLRDGLIALSTSPLQGNLRGKDKEFRDLLGEKGVVELGSDATNSVGRKWRSALNKLGFLYPEVPEAPEVFQEDIGPIDMITPNGLRLIQAETVPAMQECFLRSLAAYYIPSVVEKRYDFDVFSPLRHTLAIMLELEKKTGDSRLNFLEMALVVQLTNSNDLVPEIVNRILEIRNRREATTRKRQFDQQERETVAAAHEYEPQTFNDYADTNIRYLKATGLVQSKGHGISFVPEKHVFIEKLIEESGIPSSDESYLITLCNGAALPTDDKNSAIVVLEDLLKQLKAKDIQFTLGEQSLETAADIAVVRHNIEELLSARKEEEYATNQAIQWEEIVAFMKLIITRSRKAKFNDEEIEVPQAEAPAYFEWVLWRAFLAIDGLVNKPYEARRFKIDQDFLPVGTAPGNGPDLIFEFEKFALVIEVTLTDNSRQEAAEGEPVRRHVADLATHYMTTMNKPVYGLFIANRIDSNTAETFRIGVWYARNDDKMRLDIVPLTLTQFKDFFEALFRSGRVNIDLVRELLDACGSFRLEHEAPAWKREIELLINSKIEQMS